MLGKMYVWKKAKKKKTENKNIKIKMTGSGSVLLCALYTGGL